MRGYPDNSSAIFEHCPHALLVEARLFADGDILFAALQDDASIVGSDPEISALADQNCVYRFMAVVQRGAEPKWSEAEAVKACNTFGRADEQKPVLRLDDRADVTLRKTIFHVPLLFLIFGERHRRAVWIRARKRRHQESGENC